MPGEGTTVYGHTRAQIEEAQSTWWGRVKMIVFAIVPPDRRPRRSDCPCGCGRFEPHEPYQLAKPAVPLLLEHRTRELVR